MPDFEVKIPAPKLKLAPQTRVRCYHFKIVKFKMSVVSEKINS